LLIPNAVASHKGLRFFISVKLNKQLTGDDFMSSNQLQNLMQDSQDLGTYAEKLLKKGKDDLASKIKKKQQYLDDHIKMATEAA
jgi:phage shock protein A